MNTDFYFFADEISLNNSTVIPKEYFHAALQSSLRLKRTVIIYNSIKSEVDLTKLSKQHYHSTSQFIFINISLKNQIKTIDLSKNLNTYAILKAYLDSHY